MTFGPAAEPAGQISMVGKAGISAGHAEGAGRFTWRGRLPLMCCHMRNGLRKPRKATVHGCVREDGSAGRRIDGLGRACKARMSSPLTSQRLRPFLTEWNGRDLHLVKDLIEAGKITPVARGKIVITVSGASQMRQDTGPD